MEIEEQVIYELQRIKGVYEKKVNLLFEAKRNKGFDEDNSDLIDAQLQDLAINTLNRIFGVLNAVKHANSYKD